MSEETINSIQKLLKVIVALMLRGGTEQELNLQQRIGVLHELGLKPAEIAEILGKTQSHVNKELTLIRRSQKKGR